MVWSKVTQSSSSDRTTDMVAPHRSADLISIANRWIYSTLATIMLLSLPARAEDGRQLDGAGGSVEIIEGEIHRDVTFLLKSQRPGGSWKSSQNTKEPNTYASAPEAHHAFRTVAAVVPASVHRQTHARPSPIDTGAKTTTASRQVIRPNADF